MVCRKLRHSFLVDSPVTRLESEWGPLSLRITVAGNVVHVLFTRVDCEMTSIAGMVVGTV